MVLLDDVLASNAKISAALPPGLVAVFAGATTGIGESTLKTFVRYAIKPRIYLMARSSPSAQRVISECKEINPDADLHFVKVDLSFVKETDRACDEIKSREKTVNVIVLSAGELLLDRQLTKEGLHHFLTATYYTRLRIAQNFIPQLETASKTSPIARVLNVAGGTKEGEVDTTDLPALRMPFTRIRPHITSMISLVFETLSDQAPTVSFIHDFPGAVPTPLGHETPGFLGMLYRIFMWTLKYPLYRWVCVPIKESGERHVYLATSARYPPREGNAVGVPLQGGTDVESGTDGGKGSGMYAVDWDCDNRSSSVVPVLDRLRKKGVKELVWEHTNGEFVRIANS
ncbi:hypothetical protein EJ04DRAFT_512866 [Polyplosphaeria fusca]|uniref:NAD(P)-binding protein n=1 Tax=Polyplosphaeria fusca TaxID=682080 RepID=A0A9P4QZA6_9PLEO|nr:hypothetical protein EJ04DRAFT_512866 [Polyplosphaeria fusca]